MILLFLILLVSFAYKFGSSFNAILPTSRTIGAFATFLASLSSFLPKLRIQRPCCCATHRLRCLPFGPALCLYGQFKRSSAGKCVHVTRWYLAMNVLPSGRVTLFGVSLFIIIIWSRFAIFIVYQWRLLLRVNFIFGRLAFNLFLLTHLFLPRPNTFPTGAKADASIGKKPPLSCFRFLILIVYF